MRNLYGVISCCVLLSLAVVLDNAHAKQPQKSAEVSAISLDVLRVKACAVGQGCSTVGGPKQWNLFDLAEGKTDFANQVLMPAKTHELRLMLGSKSTITVDGQTYSLTVPSGQVSGLKLKGNKVFTNASGFLKSIRLNFDLAKGLVVQAKKVKGKGKKDKDTVVYSYSLKPVIQVSSAEVTPMPENMAGVFVMPDESSKLKLGKDFLLAIPAGAVSAPVLITAEEIKYSVEVQDATTGAIVKKPGLASTYELKPEGTQFVKPVKVSVRYHTDTLRESIPENSLTVLHDIENLKTNIDTNNKIATANISHFSRITVTYLDFSQCRIKNKYNTYPETEVVEDGIVHGKCAISFMESNGMRWIPYRLVAIDRMLLKDKYELRILAKESSSSKSGTFKTSTVKDLADTNKAVVAINGTLFGGSPCTCTYLPDSLCSPPCYEKETEGVYPTGTTVMDGYLKRRQPASYKEVFMAFGDDNSGGIPIKRITKNEDFYSLFKNEFSNSYEDSIPQFTPESTYRSLSQTSHIGNDNSAMRWMFSSRTTLIKTDNSGIHCSYEYPDLHHPLPDSGDEITAIGYNSDAIFFLVSEQSGVAPAEFQYYTDVCSVLNVYDTKEAVMLDGGGSSQLVINGELINAAQGSYTPRHVVNAIGLVPKDQDDNGDNGDGDGDDDNSNGIKIEEDQARCGGTDEYWHKQDVGSGGKSLWTYNNDSSHGVDNYCTYEFDNIERGKKWEVKVYIPSKHATTSHACYEISDGRMPIGAEVDQYPVYDDWVSLGVFKAEGDFLKVSLTDWTDHEGYGDHSVGFDAIKIVPAPDDAEVGRASGVDSCEPHL